MPSPLYRKPPPRAIRISDYLKVRGKQPSKALIENATNIAKALTKNGYPCTSVHVHNFKYAKQPKLATLYPEVLRLMRDSCLIKDKWKQVLAALESGKRVFDAILFISQGVVCPSYDFLPLFKQFRIRKTTSQGAEGTK